VDIKCSKCYIKGAASAELTIKGDPAKIISNYTAAIEEAVHNITEKVTETIVVTMKETAQDLFTGDIFDDALQLPILDIDFDLPLFPIPAVTVRFEFEESFEVYVLLETKVAVGTTYTINLFSSTSPLGIAIGNDITAGVAVVLDLILDVRSGVEIQSGFHLTLNKGARVELDMFSPNVSDFAL
jgi:hypothetical protein